jgi:hypothetical protein
VPGYRTTQVSADCVFIAHVGADALVDGAADAATGMLEAAETGPEVADPEAGAPLLPPLELGPQATTRTAETRTSNVSSIFMFFP